MKKNFIIALILFCLMAFVSCQKEEVDNPLANTTWSYYRTTGGIFFPIEEHYSYLEFYSNTEVRRYDGAANGAIKGDVINGNYQINGNDITFNFPKIELLAEWVGAKISNNTIVVTYDHGGTTTYMKK